MTTKKMRNIENYAEIMKQVNYGHKTLSLAKVYFYGEFLTYEITWGTETSRVLLRKSRKVEDIAKSFIEYNERLINTLDRVLCI